MNVLLSVFTRVLSLAAVGYPWLPVRLLLLDRFHSAEALKTVQKPVAIILADNDGTTPPDGARRLFAGLNGPKRLWEVPSSGHNGVVANLSANEWRDVWKFAASEQ
ncbi:MAG: hypothetical protein WC076_12280 [Terrimicrobiaceae bacterium]|jgi:hypothetical protein|nr:PhoPQ-activated pathogenicity-related family protein [Terrimicrobiaceae bacterium]